MTNGDSLLGRIAELEAELDRLRAERAGALADGAILKALIEDIGKRRSVEDRLSQAQEWLSLAQEAGRVAAYTFDFGKGALDWSSSTMVLYGFPENETPTVERWLATIHPDDRASVEAVASAALEQFREVDQRFRIVLPDGSQRWIQDRGRVLFNDDGSPARLVGINIDVTDLVDLERRAREDGERLRLALAAGDNACWEWEIDTGTVIWDARLSELAGVTAFGGCFDDFWTLVHEDDKPKVRTALDAAIAGERDYAIEFRMVLPDGGIRWTHTQAGVIRDAAGRAVRMVGIDADITRQKKLESSLHDNRLFLESVLGASPDCVKVIEADGTLSYMNDNGIGLMEVSDIRLMLGRSWSDFWPPESKAMIDEAVRTACAGTKVSFEAQCPTAAGTTKWWDVSVAPISGKDGEVERCVAISRDVTGRKEADEQLRLLNAELHHRVKNNLATVQALARATLRSSSHPAAFERAFSARLEALGKTYTLLRVGPEAATLHELVVSELDPFGGLAEERLTIDGPNVRLSSAAAVSIGMILHELTTNASKYGALAREDGRLSVSWRLEAGGVDLTWIEVGTAGPFDQKSGGGFGSILIDRLVRQLKGTIRRRWEPAGLAVELHLPRLEER